MSSEYMATSEIWVFWELNGEVAALWVIVQVGDEEKGEKKDRGSSNGGLSSLSESAGVMVGA